jgi:methionyl-tRNA formyltransferase
MTGEISVVLVAEESAGAQVARMIGDEDRLRFAALVTTDESAVARVGAALGVYNVAPERLASGWSPPPADLLVNVHSLHVLPRELIDQPRLGAWNLHPGPLPEWAGLNTVSWAILEEAETYGVTLHRMTPTVDAGPVFARTDFELKADDTAIGVYGRCVREGLRLVRDLFDRAIAGEEVETVAQHLERRRWFGAGVPDAVTIDWEGPASRIAAVVRACDYGPFSSPWGRAHTFFEGGTVEVLTARARDGAADRPPGTVVAATGPVALVATGQGTLEIDRVRVDGLGGRAGEVLRIGTVLGRNR